MGLLSKILGGSTALLLVVCFVLFGITKIQKKSIINLKSEEEKTREKSELLVIKVREDSLEHLNSIKEMQSVMQQVNNKNKSLERENTQLRKGIRLDLLTVRKRTFSNKYDSVYTIGYKYIDK